MYMYIYIYIYPYMIISCRYNNKYNVINNNNDDNNNDNNINNDNNNNNNDHNNTRLLAVGAHALGRHEVGDLRRIILWLLDATQLLLLLLLLLLMTIIITMTILNVIITIRHGGVDFPQVKGIPRSVRHWISGPPPISQICLIIQLLSIVILTYVYV